MFSKVLLTAVAIFPTMLVAQSEGKAKLAATEFTEVVKSAAEISGARLVGVARFGSKAESDEPIDVSAHIPTGWAGSSACLTVLSVDGFYQSHGTYSIAADWPGGTIALDYPTENPHHVQSIAHEGIAPLLRNGACGDALHENALVFWGQELSGQVAVLLNTSRSEETFLYFPDDPEIADVACDAAEFENRTAFDTVCMLPVDLMSRSELTIGTVSFKRGEMGQEVEFTLHISEG